jgi:hypothetical protein
MNHTSASRVGLLPTFIPGYERLPGNIPSYISAIPDTLQGLDTISEPGVFGLADPTGQYFPPNMTTPLGLSTPQMGIQSSRGAHLLARVTQYNPEVADSSPCKFNYSGLLYSQNPIFALSPQRLHCF